MKKNIFYLLAVVLFTSCNNEISEDLTNDFNDNVLVTFNYGIECGNIARSFDDEVLSNLEYSYPTTIYLFGKNGQDYVLDMSNTSTKTFSIQKGTYNVSSYFKQKDSSIENKIYSDNKVNLNCYGYGTLFSPSFGTITLGEKLYIDGEGEYTIKLHPTSIIIAVSKNEVDEFTLSGIDNNLKKFNTDNYSYCILNFTSDPYPCQYEFIIKTNENSSYEESKKTLSVIGADFGKYYIFHPQSKNTTTLSFIEGYDNWEELYK